MKKISLKYNLLPVLLLVLFVFLQVRLAGADEVPAKNYFGKYVSADGNGGVVESLERVDLVNKDISKLNPQHIYVDDRGMPLAFFNEKGQTISKDDMLQGSRQRMEREQQMGGSGTFFKDGYVRDSDYYGRLTGYNPNNNNPGDDSVYKGRNTAQSPNVVQSQGKLEVSGPSSPSVGTGLLPTPKTLSGETVGLSGGTPIDPSKLSADSIPDGFVLMNGALVKDPVIREKAVMPKEQWPADRMEKSWQSNAEGLLKVREQAKVDGRELTTDELRLAACRLDIQNRVYVNPNIKLTPEEIEKEATKQVQEWKRDNLYMLSDGKIAGFGPGGVEGWVQEQRENREKFIRETRASVEKMAKGVTPGLTPEGKEREDKVRAETLKNQADFEKSMREDSEKKIVQLLKDTGVADPGRSNSTVSKPALVAYALPKMLVSYEKASDKK